MGECKLSEEKRGGSFCPLTVNVVIEFVCFLFTLGLFFGGYPYYVVVYDLLRKLNCDNYTGKIQGPGGKEPIQVISQTIPL